MGYGIKIFVPRPLHYVTRSPGCFGEQEWWSGESAQLQPRPQGLLLDDFQNGGSSVEDPGTQRTNTIADWYILLRVHTCTLIGVFL